jgi:hypothetical protein
MTGRGLVARSSRDPLPEERGADLSRDRGDVVPDELRHRPETVEVTDGPPFDRCRFCGAAGRVGSINPFAECPARELPSAVEVRAETAEADDSQPSLPSVHAQADGGRSE